MDTDPTPTVRSGERSTFGRERITGALGWRLAFLGIQGGSSLLLTSWLSHVLGREALAATMVAQGIIVIAQAIGDFGLSQAAVTLLPSRIAQRPEARAELVAGAARAYVGAALLGFVVSLGAALLVPPSAMLPVLVSAPATAAAVLVSGADGILRAGGEFRRPVVLMAISEGAGMAGIPVAVLTHSAVLTCAAISIGMAVGALASVRILVELRAVSPRAAWRPFVRASLPLGLSQVFIVLGTRADTLFAAALSGIVAAGAFEGSWRIFQLSQYLAGGLASALAPFVADALGAGRLDDGLRLLRGLMFGLLAVGLIGGAVLYVARVPIAGVLTGSLSGPVIRVLPSFAALTPIAAVGTLAYFTLIGRDGQRRYVLACIAAGAVVNVALVAVLGSAGGAQGVVTGCGAGIAVVNVLLLLRLATVVHELRRERNSQLPAPAVITGAFR